MINWREGKVISLLQSWDKCQEILVELPNGEQVKALAYLEMVGMPQVADKVLLSAAAVTKKLGTGGLLFVVAILDRLLPDPTEFAGHLVKARYTPLQFMVQGADEQDSPYHELLANAQDIAQMPVIATDLHSALPAIVTGIRAVNTQTKIAYIMTDGAALPAWFSRTISQLKNRQDILGTITCGQAFGGDLEAVNIYTALLAAKHIWQADVAIVAQGPGNLGTGTRWGFSGTQIGEALNAVKILQGTAVAALRMSNGDKRPRHFGISHHSMRLLTEILTFPCTVVVPTGMEQFLTDPDFFVQLETQLSQLASYDHLDLVPQDVSILDELLANSPYTLRTMGRPYAEDKTAFLAAAAAGMQVATALQQ